MSSLCRNAVVHVNKQQIGEGETLIQHKGVLQIGTCAFRFEYKGVLSPLKVNEIKTPQQVGSAPFYYYCLYVWAVGAFAVSRQQPLYSCICSRCSHQSVMGLIFRLAFTTYMYARKVDCRVKVTTLILVAFSSTVSQTISKETQDTRVGQEGKRERHTSMCVIFIGRL